MGISIALVPDKRDVHTGFGNLEDTIKHYSYAKIGDALQIPDYRAWVGYKIHTEHFNSLKNFPGKKRGE